MKIKNKTKIFLYSILSVFGLLLITLILVFKSATFQTWITHFIAKQIAKDSNIVINIESVDIGFFNKIILNKVCIQDTQGDTLFNIKQLSGSLTDINFNTNKIYLNTLYLDSVFFQLKKDTNKMNITPFINLFISDKTDTTATKPWIVYSNNLNIKNTRFVYKTFDAPQINYGMNYWNLDIKNINLKIENIYFDKDSITFKIASLSAKEKCGIILNKFSGNCYLSNKLIKVSNLKFKTTNTTADVDYYSMKYKEFPAFLDYNHKVKMEAKVNTAHVNFKDISYFAPTLQYFKFIADFSGYYKGTVDNFKGKNFNIRFGDNSRVYTSFSVNGLPDYEETFMYIKIDSLITNKNDIEKIQIAPLIDNKYVELPKQIDNLGTIKYKGNFTGLYNDFVAYGKIQTDAGYISTDISLKKQENSNKTRLNGTIATKKLNIGKILDADSQIGKMSLNTKINGYIKRDSVIANANGNINQIVVKGYDYKNISIDGNIINKMFDGLFQVNDSNLIMDFIGTFDFNNKEPKMDFTADVKKSNIYNLHLYNADTVANLSFKMVSQYTGLDIDKITGGINIFDINFHTSNKNIHVKDFRFSSRKNNEIMKANLTSDFLDAQIEGKYRLIELYNSVKNISSNYLPALTDYKELNDNYNNNIKFNLKFKNTENIMSFFIDSSMVSYGSTIKGVLNSNENKLKILTNIGYIKLNKSKINKLNSYIHTKNDSLLIYIKADSINIFNELNFKNTQLEITSIDNISDVNLKWDNKTKKQNIGDIFAQIDFKKINNKTIIDYSFTPSFVIVNDSTWQINDFSGSIDSSSIALNQMTINKEQQYIYANGLISRNPSDSLTVVINDFKLSFLNAFIANKNINLEGAIYGDITIKDLYNKIILNSNFNINRLLFNKNKMGNMYIASKYSNQTDKLVINASSNYNKFNAIKLTGDYEIGNNKINFKLKTNKLLTKIIQPFVKAYTSEMHGLIYSNINIGGTINKPKFGGYILPRKASLKVNYLNTKYSFSDTIYVKTNKLFFNNFIVYDEQANKGYINGSITHNFLKDFKFNLNLNVNNFLALNTTETQNDLFYGKSHISGLIRVKGNVDLLDFYVSAKTNKNTKIFIPLSNPEQIDDNNFITFVSHNTDKKKTKKEEYKVNLSGINMFFDLEFTSDAELQIIFDEKVGDIIKVRGNGKIDMNIDKTSKFTINGEYFVSQGTYLFTLQNILNKKFNIKPGGYIKWTGDIYSATTNLEAIYKLKASPYNLTFNPEDKPRIPIECQLNLSNKLLSPNISFGLNIPKASDRLTNIIDNLSGEELNRQILFLLVTNNFYTNQELLAGADYQQTSGNAIGKTSGELLSNQLSNWLSKISDDFDIGVNYRPGDEISSDEVEVALSTQILNDRVLLNGNVGFGEYQTKNSTTNNIAGNFNIEVMVNKSGSLRLKGFNEVNDNAAYKNSLYTQGVGLFYREEFNSFDELKTKYMNAIKKLLKKSYDSE